MDVKEEGVEDAKNSWGSHWRTTLCDVAVWNIAADVSERCNASYFRAEETVYSGKLILIHMRTQTRNQDGSLTSAIRTTRHYFGQP
jgi:hypothetical protein